MSEKTLGDLVIHFSRIDNSIKRGINDLLAIENLVHEGDDRHEDEQDDPIQLAQAEKFLRNKSLTKEG